MAMVGTLKEFDSRSDDIQVYLGRLEQFFLANDITQEPKKAAILLTCIGDQTYKLLQDLAIPKEVGQCTYSELTQLLKQQLEPRHSIFAERCKFHRAQQQETESISEWVARLKHLAQYCKFGEYLDTALRDQFIAGMKNVQILDRLFAEPESLTFPNAIEIATRIEVAKQHRNNLIMDSAGIKNPTTKVDYINTKEHSYGVKTKSCTCCGKDNHARNQCKYSNYKCNHCGKIGHLAKICFHRKIKHDKPQNIKKTSKSASNNYVQECKEDTNTTQKEEQEVLMHNMEINNSVQPITLELSVNDKTIPMQLDTGAGVSILPNSIYKKEFPNSVLKETNLVLKSFSGNKMYPNGAMDVTVEYGDIKKKLELFIVETDGPPLLGRNWIRDLQISIPIFNIPTNEQLEDILKKHEDLWTEELGIFNKTPLTLNVAANAKPKFFKPRPIPYALREKVERELDRLVSQGILIPVDNSEWGTPIVPIMKPDGNIRICGDYKVTVNPVLVIDKYPLPKIEDLFAKLDGGTEYSKIDLSQAYQQCLLDEQSRKYVTISTHKGLFQYTRLPFGISSAPAMFQRIMEQLFQNIPNVICFLDDILISGKNKEEHLQTLDQVLTKLQQNGLKIKKEKCTFFQKSVTYLGYVIDKKGLHTSQDKVDAIKKAPPPQNQQQLKAFLGMVNYYGKFIKNLSTILHPLHQLLKKNVPWKWSASCQRAFENVKEALSSTEVLAHYSTDLPVKLACDASNYGIGAVLSHVFPVEGERPIAFASRTLSRAEQNYSQIDKEALAIVYGLKKFNQYLFGRHFTIVTDHKPLIAIFKPDGATPTMAASRLQRWSLMLSSHDYDIEYVTSKNNCNADGLSRLPMDIENTSLDQIREYSYLNYVEDGVSVLDAKKIAKYSRQDRTLAEVIDYVNYGWPQSESQVRQPIKPFWHKRNELYVEMGCLMWGYRVIIPFKLRTPIKNELHETHQGIVKMKAIARSFVWWPGIDREIEALANECEVCANYKPMPEKAQLINWDWPTVPWHRIHVDFFGPLNNRHYLTVVDAHSKWLEVFAMKSTKTELTLTKLRELCARFGLPNHIVSDNGSQFLSDEFHLFCKRNGIKHTRTATYHPSTNGAVEIVIRNVKQALLKISDDDALQKYLLRYRITPHSTTGETPAKLMFGRELKTRLNLLRPNVEDKVKDIQHSQQRNYKGKRNVEFSVGEKVWVTKYSGKKKSWISAIILEICSNRNYLVQTQDGDIWKRHVDQIRPRYSTDASPTSFDEPENIIQDNISEDSEE